MFSQLSTFGTFRADRTPPFYISFCTNLFCLFTEHNIARLKSIQVCFPKSKQQDWDAEEVMAVVRFQLRVYMAQGLPNIFFILAYTKPILL